MGHKIEGREIYTCSKKGSDDKREHRFWAGRLSRNPLRSWGGRWRRPTISHLIQSYLMPGKLPTVLGKNSAQWPNATDYPWLKYVAAYPHKATDGFTILTDVADQVGSAERFAVNLLPTQQSVPYPCLNVPFVISQPLQAFWLTKRYSHHAHQPHLVAHCRRPSRQTWSAHSRHGSDHTTDEL